MLYRFNIELSDIDRGVYEKLDFRVAQHPSEIDVYLLTRVLAYVLSYQENLEFSPSGLSDPDAPALLAKNLQGGIEHWIEIGNASPKKLHKAAKTAKQISIFTYKNAEHLLSEIKAQEVHRASEFKIYSFDSNFLNLLEQNLVKNNQWSIMIQQNTIDVTIKENNYSTELKKW